MSPRFKAAATIALREAPISRRADTSPSAPRDDTMRKTLTALELAIGSVLLVGFIAFAMQGVAGLMQLVL